MRWALRALGAAASLSGVAAFAPSLLPATTSAGLRPLAHPSICGARMVAARRLDPMQLVQDKAMQTCPLRPYRSAEEHHGLATATFALG